jgi:hypothetical protein
MFMIHLSQDVHIGDTVDVRINQQPARVTWQDPSTLVIGPGDAPRIVRIKCKPGMNTLICADEDGSTDFKIIDPYMRYESPEYFALEKKLEAVPGLQEAVECLLAAEPDMSGEKLASLLHGRSRASGPSM